MFKKAIYLMIVAMFFVTGCSKIIVEGDPSDSTIIINTYEHRNFGLIEQSDPKDLEVIPIENSKEKSIKKDAP